MNEKEKARELIESKIKWMEDNMAIPGSLMIRIAIQFSINEVDEIILACEYNNVESWNTDWWNKVKKEIEIL